MSTFVDTNILAYAYDKKAGQKYERARDIIVQLCKGSTRPFLSTQVIQELHAQLLRFGYPSAEAVRISRLYLSWSVISVTPELLERSFEIRLHYGLSVWDSSIVAAAQLACVTELLSEDLQSGQHVEGVKIVNPFMA